MELSIVHKIASDSQPHLYSMLEDKKVMFDGVQVVIRGKLNGSFRNVFCDVYFYDSTPKGSVKSSWKNQWCREDEDGDKIYTEVTEVVLNQISAYRKDERPMTRERYITREDYARSRESEAMKSIIRDHLTDETWG